jgi:hypothetical protein
MPAQLGAAQFLNYQALEASNRTAEKFTGDFPT